LRRIRASAGIPAFEQSGGVKPYLARSAGFLEKGRPQEAGTPALPGGEWRIPAKEEIIP
jgi:hypothetical protein